MNARNALKAAGAVCAGWILVSSLRTGNNDKQYQFSKIKSEVASASAMAAAVGVQTPQPLTVNAQASGREPAVAGSRLPEIQRPGAGTLVQSVDRYVSEPNHPWVVRARAVEISNELAGILHSMPKDKRALKSLPAAMRSFQFELFKDRPVNIVVEAAKDSMANGLIVRGKIEGQEDSAVTIIHENGIMYADIRIEHELYEVRPTAKGPVIKQIDRSKMEPDHPVEHEKYAADFAAEEIVENLSGAPITTQAILTGTPVTIDILVGYTPTVRRDEGSDAAVRAMAQLIVEKANDSFELSNILITARLVGVWAAESDPVNIDDFDRLIAPSDGKWDGVHAARRAVGADIVTLVTPNLVGSCGRGTIRATAATAFSLLDHLCISNNTGVHEIGHNMGAQHDRDHAGNSSTPYAYGYKDLSHCFRDVMSYPDGCTRLTDYFSNPDIRYNGYVMGTETENNARAINERRDLMAAFFPTVVGGGTNPPPTPVLSLSVLGSPSSASWSVQASGVTAARIEFLDNGTLIATDSASPYCLFGDSNGACLLSRRPADGAHAITARAFDSANTLLAEASVTVTQATPPPPPPVGTLTMRVLGTPASGSWSVQASGINSPSRIEFLVNGVLRMTERSAPYCLFADNNGVC